MKVKLDWERTLHVNIFFLRVFGLWPKTTYKCDLYTVHALLLTASQTSLFLLEVVQVHQVRTDILAVLDVCLFIAGHILNTIKVATIALNHQEITKILKLLQSELFQPQNPSQSKMVETQMRFWRNLYGVFVGPCGVLGLLWVLLPIFTGSYKGLTLPVPAACPACDHFLVFPLIYIFVSVAIYSLTMAGFNIDLFVFALFLSIENQFEILCGNLVSLDVGFEENLLRAIKHHQQIIKYTTKVNNLCNFIIFAQFFLSTVIIALFVLQGNMLVPGSFLFYTRYCTCMLFINQIFVYCYFGENIATKSKKLCYSLFESSWFKQSLSVLKILLMFSLNSSPVRISAFNIFYMSLETFVKIMKSAYSFLMILGQAANDS